jgi:hypothetical protein
VDAIIRRSDDDDDDESGNWHASGEKRGGVSTAERG